MAKRPAGDAEAAKVNKKLRGEEQEEDAPAESDEEAPAEKKSEKAVKIKKIFLRILRKTMDIHKDSLLMKVWREERVGRRSGRTISEGYYGIEVMDVEEVDQIIVKLLPEVNVYDIGQRDPAESIALLLSISSDAAKKYIIREKGRYRLNEDALPPEATTKVKALKKFAKEMDEEAQQKETKGAAAPDPVVARVPISAHTASPYDMPHQLPEHLQRSNSLTTSYNGAFRPVVSNAIRPKASQAMTPGAESIDGGLHEYPAQDGHPVQAAGLLHRTHNSLYRSPSDAAHMLVKNTSGQGLMSPLNCLDCGKDMPCGCTKTPVAGEGGTGAGLQRSGLSREDSINTQMKLEKFKLDTSFTPDMPREGKRAKLIALLGDTFQHVWHICKQLEVDTLENMTKRTCGVLECALQDPSFDNNLPK